MASEFEIQINSPVTEPWILAVGKLILNFGVIELLSHRFLAELARDPVLTWVGGEMPLGKRKDLNVDLVRREKLDKEAKNRLVELWQGVKRLSTIRNTIAHGPLLFRWSGEEVGDPDFIAVPNIRATARKKGRDRVLVTLKELNTAVDEISGLAQGLDKVVSELREKPEAGPVR